MNTCVCPYSFFSFIVVYHCNMLKYPEQFQLVSLCVSLYLSGAELLEYVPALLILKDLASLSLTLMIQLGTGRNSAVFLRQVFGDLLEEGR